MFLPVRRKLIIWIILCVLSCVAALVLHINGDFQLYNAAGDRFSAAFAIPIFTVGAGIFYFGIHLASVYGYWRIVKKHEREGDSQPAAHPLAQALWPYWQFGLTPPCPRDVFRVAERSTDFDRNRALIVCLREIQLPVPSDHFFEPVVVAPSGGIRDFSVPTALGCTMLVAFCNWFFALGVPTGALYPIYAIVGGHSAVWLWLRALRPRYFRFAPGIVQVLRFEGPLRQKPLIHTYPADAGTIFVFKGFLKSNNWQSAGIGIDICRGSELDRVNIRPGDIDDPTRQQILAAIISTARIPELSETDLVG